MREPAVIRNVVERVLTAGAQGEGEVGGHGQKIGARKLFGKRRTYPIWEPRVEKKGR